MARDWKELFKTWSKPPSETEEEKGANAAKMIREAIRGDASLSKRNIDVYATGSYANNTNVRQDSDIDVAIVLQDVCCYDLRDGLTPAEIGIGTGSYGLEDFRAEVHRALAATFGNQQVRLMNKTLTVRASSTRLNADATPFLLHRRYTRRPEGGSEYIEGAELRPRSDPQRRVINWHRQHYDKGVAKNDRTHKRFKRVVRILKNLSSDMASSGDPAAKNAAAVVPSFLLECLVYNTPNDKLGLDDSGYYEDVKAVVSWLWNQTKPEAGGTSFTEVSGLKPLFAKEQAWTMAQAHELLLRAWNHVGFQ